MQNNHFPGPHRIGTGFATKMLTGNEGHVIHSRNSTTSTSRGSYQHINAISKITKIILHQNYAQAAWHQNHLRTLTPLPSPPRSGAQCNGGVSFTLTSCTALTGYKPVWSFRMLYIYKPLVCRTVRLLSLSVCPTCLNFFKTFRKRSVSLINCRSTLYITSMAYIEHYPSALILNT